MADYPDTPGHRGVDTSIEAGASFDLARLQRMVGGAIREAGETGRTAEESADHLGLSRAAAQPRTTELKHKGLIRDSGQRRFNRSGKRAIVWVAVSRGEVAQ